MSHGPWSELIIYSPLMAVTGYFLLPAMFLGERFLPIVLATIASLGAFIFLNHLKGKSRLWWIGMAYPFLLILIIITELFSLAFSGNVYGSGMTFGRMKHILSFLIAPVSLFFFAAMTPEYRKIMRVPVLIAVIIGIFMLVPVYDELSAAYFNENEGETLGSNLTGGFVILILGGFYGMTALGIISLIQSLKISGILRTDVLSGRSVQGESQYE